MKSVKVTQFKNISILVVGAVVIASASYFAGTKKANENDDQLPSLAMETSSHVMALQTALLVMAKDLKVSPKAMEEMVALYTSVPPTRRDFATHFEGKK